MWYRARIQKIQISFIVLIVGLFAPSINAQISTLEIWEIQGQQKSSPFVDSTITTERNIVTYVTNDRFFIQCPPERSDNEVLSSDGIMVYTDTPSGLNVGDLVTVTGRIQEYYELTEFGPNNLSYSVDSTGVALPAAIPLTATFPSNQAQLLPDLERLEGMRVSIEAAKITGPTEDSGVAYATMNNTSMRPFREAGILFPGQSGYPVWDGNPEVFQVNLRWAGISLLYPGEQISAEGVLSYSNGIYQVIPATYQANDDAAVRPVSPPAVDEGTIASLNCYLLFDGQSDYPARRFKVANYIIQQLQAPDIVAVQEVESLTVLRDVASEINELDPNLEYEAFLEIGNGNFPINLGFLVKNTVINPQITQIAKDQNLSLGGKLHDRPPLLLEAEFNTNPPTPIKVLNLHLRSLNGIEGSDSTYTRTKRYEQSVSVADEIQPLRQNSNLVVVGDFNAFQFSDGYVDVVNQLSGQPSLGAQFWPVSLVVPPMTNQSALLDSAERYSYVYRGNAQILDHCLTSEQATAMVNRLEYARGNADAPESLVSNSFVEWRVSDHDGFVLYLQLSDSLTVNTPLLEVEENQLLVANPFSEETSMQVKLGQAQTVIVEVRDVQGRLVFQRDYGWQNAGVSTLDFQPNLATGMYYIGLLNEKAQPLVVKRRN